jgi:DNA-directed RNA polymerase subunit RPC12/RpoP
MQYRCPGSTGVIRPTLELLTCPKCGKEVEIFSDEQKARCDNCGETVFREASPTCFDWCKYAEKCLEEIERQRKRKLR